MAEIVVGIDGSAASERGLRVAMAEAALRGDEVRVLHSWSTAPYVGSVPGYSFDLRPIEAVDRSTWAHEVVDDVVNEARAAMPAVPEVRVITDVRAGDAGTDLVQASTVADLVVLGARRHGPLASAVIGSATNHVLHHAHCPVLVVPAGTGPVHGWNRVVVGVDGSEHADAALRWAAAEAAAHRCPLLVVHAWGLFSSPDRFDSTDLDPQQVAKHVEEWLHDRVQGVLPDVGDLRVDVRTVRDEPAGGLLSATGPEDLLVIGSRGHGAVKDLLLGSVALQCAHHARSAIAVLRPGTGSTP